MADEIDLANDLIDVEVSRALSKLRQNSVQGSEGSKTGYGSVGIACWKAAESSVLSYVCHALKNQSVVSNCLLTNS